MKIFIILLFGLISFSYSQTMKIERAIPNSEVNGDWGGFSTVYGFQPLGKMSAVQHSNGTLYVAVSDTLATANLGVVVYTSTNQGNTWTLFPTGIAYRGEFQNLKMVRSPQDSIYIFVNNYSIITCWNVLTGSLTQFNPYPAGYRDFDVVCSSTGSLYLILDLLANNQVRFWGSTDGGFNWGSTVFLSSTAVHSRMTISATGDTVIINYYGVTIQPDTVSSTIRSVRYRESVPGTLVIAGTFSNIVLSNSELRKQFMAAFGNGEVWLIYTAGVDGARMIYGIKSIDNGTTFGSPQLISVSSNTDNYWFDVKYLSNLGTGVPGFGLVYFSDSLQVGPPTNATDKLMYCSAPYGGSFNSPVRISSVPLSYSNREYIPQLVPMPYSTTDFGTLWVGENASVNRLYWDRLQSLPVELTSFTSKLIAGTVQLEWSTATELNNFGFDIERKTIDSENRNANWQKIGFVNGNGTSSIVNYYSFNDKIDGSTGKFSYRLKQIDFDGSSKYSPEILVDLTLPVEFSLKQNYPNPFNPSTTIEYSLPTAGHVSLKVYDLLGKELMSLINEEKPAGNYDVDFNAGNLSSGFYIYQLRSGSFVQSKKMLLMK